MNLWFWNEIDIKESGKIVKNICKKSKNLNNKYLIKILIIQNELSRSEKNSHFYILKKIKKEVSISENSKN